jgi:hypothetical protein
MSIAGNKPSTASVDRDGKRAVVLGAGGKVHHRHGHDRPGEVVETGFAHKHIGPDGTAYRSTRGFAAVKGELPAVDIQPRRGKAKGGPVAVAFGQHHVGEDGNLQVGISRTAAASALRGDTAPTDPPKIGKVFAVPGVTRGMEAHANDSDRGHAVRALGDAVWADALAGSKEHTSGLKLSALPGTVGEKT